MIASEKQTLKRQNEDSERPDENSEEPITKKQHGCLPPNLDIDKDRLMEEASTWTEDQKVNWSNIGSRYGLTQANRGEIVKEYLAEQGIGITTATHEERSTRAPKRAKKGFLVEISYTSPACTKVLIEKVKEKIANGDIEVGVLKLHTHPTKLTNKMK